MYFREFDKMVFDVLNYDIYTSDVVYKKLINALASIKVELLYHEHDMFETFDRIPYINALKTRYCKKFYFEVEKGQHLAPFMLVVEINHDTRYHVSYRYGFCDAASFDNFINNFATLGIEDIDRESLAFLDTIKLP